MADRLRSKDGTRDTDKFIEDMPETPGQQGRSGGEIARDVGTQDSLEKATEQGVKGTTRVRKSDERPDAEDDA